MDDGNISNKCASVRSSSPRTGGDDVYVGNFDIVNVCSDTNGACFFHMVRFSTYRINNNSSVAALCASKMSMHQT
jgi:hypothetical protein